MADKSTELDTISGTQNGTDLVVPSTGATVPDIRFALKNGLRLYVAEDQISEEEFLLRQLDRGDTEDSILGQDALTKLEDLLNTPVHISAYHGMRNSTFEGSKLGVFVIFDVTDQDGRVFTTSAGSSDVIVKITQLLAAGLVPQPGWTIFERSDKPTASGFFPINMRQAQDPTGF